MTDALFDTIDGGAAYAFTLPSEGVRVEVRHLRRESRQLHGEVDVLCDWAGAQTINGSLSCADLNLSSQTARGTRAAYCRKRAKSKPAEFDWDGVIDEACRQVIQAERDGLDAIVLDDAPAAGPPKDFLVHGLPIPADSHSQLIADGGGLKSLLLLLTLGEMAKQDIPVLLLDWEWNATRHLARKRRLFGSDRLASLFYLRCRNSLMVEREHVRRFCEDRGVQFIALDSISAACDGKLADDDVARAYNRALDDLPPSLAAAHIPKGTPDQNADLKAFGSAFFHNYARMTWTVRKQAGDSDDSATVLLVPYKQNDGPRARPVALQFTFTAERIQVRNIDPATVPGYVESLPLWQRMKAALLRGPLTLAALAKELDASVDTLDRTVRRKDGLFVRIEREGVTHIALVESRTA